MPLRDVVQARHDRQGHVGWDLELRALQRSSVLPKERIDAVLHHANALARNHTGGAVGRGLALADSDQALRVVGQGSLELAEQAPLERTELGLEQERHRVRSVHARAHARLYRRQTAEHARLAGVGVHHVRAQVEQSPGETAQVLQVSQRRQLASHVQLAHATAFAPQLFQIGEEALLAQCGNRQ